MQFWKEKESKYKYNVIIFVSSIVIIFAMLCFYNSRVQKILSLIFSIIIIFSYDQFMKREELIHNEKVEAERAEKFRRKKLSRTQRKKENKKRHQEEMRKHSENREKESANKSHVTQNNDMSAIAICAVCVLCGISFLYSFEYIFRYMNNYEFRYQKIGVLLVVFFIFICLSISIYLIGKRCKMTILCAWAISMQILLFGLDANQSFDFSEPNIEKANIISLERYTTYSQSVYGSHADTNYQITLWLLNDGKRIFFCDSSVYKDYQDERYITIAIHDGLYGIPWYEIPYDDSE